MACAIITIPMERKISGDIKEINGRGDWIRTSDPLTPSQVRYRAALRPDLPKRLGSFMISAMPTQAENAEATNKNSAGAVNVLAREPDFLAV